VVKFQLHAGGIITTYTPSNIAAGQILATIAGTDISALGNYDIWVVNPAPPAADASNKWPVTVTDTPITGLSAANSSPTTLGATTHLTATITSGSNVSYTWNFGDGSAATSLTRTTSASYTYTAAGFYTAIVTATNSLGANITATTAVTINNPVPVITALSPGSVTTGTLSLSTTTAITLTGSNFVAGAVVKLQLQAGGVITSYSPSAITSGQILVTIPAADIAVAANYVIWVVDPAPPVADESNKWPVTVS
jgi:PKD repeat protein